MGRDTIQLEDAISTISREYLLEFTSEYGIPENLHPELPGPEETILDFPEGKVDVYTKFFEFANYCIPLSQFLFDILGYYHIHLSQLSVIGTGASCTQRKVFMVSFGWIIPNSFLSSILLLVVVMVILVVIVVAIVGVVIIIAIIGVVVKIMIIVEITIIGIVVVIRIISGVPSIIKLSFVVSGFLHGITLYPPMFGHKTANSWNLLTPDDPIGLFYSNRLGVCIPPGQGIIGQSTSNKCHSVFLGTLTTRKYRFRGSLGPVFLLGLSAFAMAAACAYRAATLRDRHGNNGMSDLVFLDTKVLRKSDVDLTGDEDLGDTGMGDSTGASVSLGEISSGEKKYRESNIGDSDNTRDGGKIVGGAIEACSGGIEMDLFNLISAPNLVKVKTGTRPLAAHEVPQLTATANRVIVMEDASGASASSGTPSIMEKSPMDFADEDPPSLITEEAGTEERVHNELWHEAPPLEDPPSIEVVPEPDLEQEVVTIGPLAQKRRRRRGNDEEDANAPPKVLRKDYAAFRPVQSIVGGKSLAAMGIAAASTITQTAQDTPAGASSVKDPDPLSYAEPQPIIEQDIAYHMSLVSLMQVFQEDGSRGRPGLGEVYLPYIHGRVARKCISARRIEAKESQIKNLEALLEAEADMKKAAKAKNAKLVKELEGFRSQFTDLQLSNHQLSQQVSTLQAQVTGEEKIKATFAEFKKYEELYPHMLKMDAHLDKLSVDFDEELYPHMLTAIAAFVNVVSAGLVKGMSEGLEHAKDLKYPLVDQLEGLKDAPMELIMTSLHLDSDSREDAPQWIRDLRPNTSQLKISVYPEVRNPRDPWAIKEEILLEDAIAANVSRAEKKKCRVVCRTHGVGSAHHARSDGVPVSVPTVVPQGLAILLTDAATQSEISEGEASPRLLRSMSLPTMHNLDWSYYRLHVDRADEIDQREIDELKLQFFFFS
ncbi:hypothetical protein Tco_0513337, partial [Tanacetum coccineum]